MLQVADARGNVVEENNFAPYGQRRDPATLAYYPVGQAPPLMLGRGFTGHEHLPRFGLVNMNARLYDPVLGRFLSPDPYVRLPYSTLGLNRYAYAMDNPLCYVDENGEFIFSFVLNFFRGLFQGKNPFVEGAMAVVNEAKLYAGIFVGNPWQTLSRLTWELPQTILGLGYSQTANLLGQVDKVVSSTGRRR